MSGKHREYSLGLKAGIPIFLGYLAVSFGFGISASAVGIAVADAMCISLTNVTSAGQLAGISVIAAGGSIAEMVLAQLIINLRYSLMGVSLTQRLSDDFGLGSRFISAFGITDEIFALAVTRERAVTPQFMYGLMTLPIIGWVAGTGLGAFAGHVLPVSVTDALGAAIYAMFVAIVIPAAKEERSVAVTVCAAAGLSCALYYIPAFSGLGVGWSVIICAVAVSAAAAVFFPVKEDAA